MLIDIRAFYVTTFNEIIYQRFFRWFRGVFVIAVSFFLSWNDPKNFPAANAISHIAFKLMKQPFFDFESASFKKKASNYSEEEEHFLWCIDEFRQCLKLLNESLNKNSKTLISCTMAHIFGVSVKRWIETMFTRSTQMQKYEQKYILRKCCENRRTHNFQTAENGSGKVLCRLSSREGKQKKSR